MNYGNIRWHLYARPQNNTHTHTHKKNIYAQYITYAYIGDWTPFVDFYIGYVYWRNYEIHTAKALMIFLQTSLPEIWTESTGFGHQVEGELLVGDFFEGLCKGCPSCPFIAQNRRIFWAKDGHWVVKIWLSYVRKLMKSSISKRCVDFESSISKKQVCMCIYIYV